MNSYIRAGALLYFPELLKDLGVEPLSLLRKVQLRPAELENSDQLISAAAFLDALDLAVSMTGKDDFGLRLGARQGFSKLGPIGMLARQCETLREALSVLDRHLALHNPGSNVGLQLGERVSFVSYEDSTAGRINSPQMCDLSLAVGMELWRQYGGKNWAPNAVFFMHAEPADLSTYRELFRCPLFFNQTLYGFEFETALLDLPQTIEDPEIKRFFKRYIEELERKYNRDLNSMVEQVIISTLGSGYCNEERVAEILQMNRRTLQRKLKSEGVTFSQLLSDVRCRMAKQFLGTTAMSLTDIACTLGYSELSAFTRFFASREGCSPSVYRKKLEAA